MDTASDPGEPSGGQPDIARDDPFRPPVEPCLCYCLHCQRQIMSDQMWFQTETRNGKVVDGTWMCPTPNCDGVGFQFDIYPVDPNHPANEGWSDVDEEDFEDDEFEDDDGGNETPPAEAESYDPAEPEYDEFETEDDLEGEEWKHGLQPGERPPESESTAEARRQFEEEQKRYDMPDERPRSIERTGDDDSSSSKGIDYGDIPF